MDKVTSHYRKRQIEMIQAPDTEYKYSIQLVNGSSGSKTNYLNISKEELNSIKYILTVGPL